MLWLPAAPDRPDGLATRGLTVAVVVGAGVTVVALAVPLVPPVPLVAVLVWSDSRVAFALASEAWAAVTALWSGLGSMVASVWPVVTVSPTDTGTLVTLPATAKP